VFARLITKATGLKVTWSKYNRLLQPVSPLREHGLQADFVIFEKSKEGNDRVVFNKTITSDINMEKYGILPVEVINQWRKVFDNSYIIGNMLK